MKQTKRCFNKEDGILGYHGYQSFKEDEVKPTIAHEIGVKLANEMWGDKYEVIVTTHLNTNHIHNHFVVNSVSFVDGKKFNSCLTSTAQLRNCNDAICNEYGLSTIKEKPTPNSNINFEYYLKNNIKRDNYYIKTKKDIDYAINKCKTYEEFLKILMSMNYTITERYGKISVRNNNYKRNIRIERMYGDEYSIDNIKHRIIEEDYFFQPIQDEKNITLKNFIKRNKSSGIIGLYKYYCYLLKIYPSKHINQYFTKEMYDDLDKLSKYNSIINLLDRTNIYDDNSFNKYDNLINDYYDKLISQRKQLRKQYDRINNQKEKDRILNKLKDFNEIISKTKKDINTCIVVKNEIKEIKNNLYEFEKERKDSELNESIK